ncbi:MAG: DUF5058 family protein [Fretibacterium sp.]|nr:DUF5058 family protein [Fretibacterium sp.]
METATHYLEIANDPMMWVMAIPVVSLVAIQAWLFTVRSYKSAPLVNLSHQQCRQAFKVGAVSAIGPAVAVFIVMVSMMAVVGAPMTWQRLAIIGAAPTELTATTMGAKAMGIEVGSPEYDVTAFASSVWTMALNGCGWLVFCGLFTHKMDKVMHKVTGGSMRLMAEVCGAAVLGTSGYLATAQSMISSPHLSAVIAAALSMALLGRFSPKWLKEYELGIAMIIGMVAAIITLKAQ